MRVATRRMRAAWRVFDGAYRPRLQRRYVRELRGVATALGTVRDLDVQIEAVGGYLAALPEEGSQSLEPLLADWRRQREAARRDLLGLLDSRDYRDFVDDYLDFVETSGSGELVANPGEPMLVRDNVGGRIWLAYERVRARGTRSNGQTCRRCTRSGSRASGCDTRWSSSGRCCRPGSSA